MQQPSDGAADRCGICRLPLALLAMSIAAGGLLATAATSDDATTASLPLHANSGQLVEAMEDTLGALLRDDAASARSALDRVDAQLRELKAEEQARFGRDIVSYSRAVKGSLNLARESSGAGNLDRTFHEFVSIQKACRICHDFARKEGLLKPRGE